MYRTKILSFFIVLGFIISLFSGCSITNDSSLKLIMGNSSGNINNGGIAAKQGDWIYFASGDSIYREKFDGSERILIIDAHANFINVVNDWIYYSAPTDRNDILYKVRTDGTSKISLYEPMGGEEFVESLHVVGDWIYFTLESIDHESQSNLYKMKTDGSKRTVIGTDYALYLNFVGDWIYYVNRDDAWKIYKMKTDGTERIKVNTESAHHIIVSENWIYYVNNNDSKIYKMKIDGTDILKLSDDLTSDLNVSEDWIIYNNQNDQYTLYRMSLDGIGTIKLNDDEANSPSIVGDEIYYNHSDGNFYYYDYGTDNGRVYKTKTDGSGRTLTVPATASLLNQEVTLNTFLKYSKGLAGELNKVFYCALLYEGIQYTIMVTTIKTHKELIGKTNVITIGIEGIARFAADSFIFFDKNGKLLSVSEGHIVDEDTLAFSSDKINLVDSVKFIGLKDLDPEKYDEEEIAVFEVSTISTE